MLFVMLANQRFDLGGIRENRLTQQEIGYAKGLGEGSIENVEKIIFRTKIRVIGLVIDKVEKILLEMELGAAGIHNQIRQWAGKPFLVNLVDLLLEKKFRIHLTSDHGNIEATGCGRPAERAMSRTLCE